MTAATAEFSSVRFVSPTGTFLSAPKRPPKQELAALPQGAPNPSDIWTDVLLGPTRIAASWLAAVERRIRDSIGVSDGDSFSDGQFVSAAVAGRATRFFDIASDLLPGEPYLYTMRGGELVAELNAAEGMLTVIVGDDSCSLFGVVNGSVERVAIDLNGGAEAARRAIQLFIPRVRLASNGAVETA